MPNHPNRVPRSGHLPGHMRDMFLDAIAVFIGIAPGSLVKYEIQYRERLISVAEACRLVWNCSDILPGSAFDQLRDRLPTPPASQTYAAAAQAVLHHLRATGQVDDEADIQRRRLYDARDSAYRDLVDVIVTHNVGGFLAEDRRLLWGGANVQADSVVEQWRGIRTDRGPTTPLEELAERVAQAEEAIEAAARQAGAAVRVA